MVNFYFSFQHTHLCYHSSEGFFFFFLSFLTVPWDMQYLSSPTKNQTHAPAVEVQSLNYWTTKEGPYGQIIITKEPRIYHGKRTVSLRNGFGKTGQPHAKE